MIQSLFPFYQNEKTALLIDGAYLYSISRNLDFDIDYSRFLKWISGRSQLLRASYYTIIQEDQEYSSIRPLVDWLDYNGFRVITKTIKEDITNTRKKRPDIHVELSVDAMAIAKDVDHLLLCIGDNDFVHLARELQNQGVRTSILGTTQSSNSITSDELRRHTDHFIEMKNIIPEICRDSTSETISGEESLPQFMQA